MISFRVELSGNRRLIEDLRQTAVALVANSSQAQQAAVTVGSIIVEVMPDYTPIDTGSLASSHAVFPTGKGAFVTIAPGAVNPWSDQSPAEYGPKVHEMGGYSRSKHRRAFYDEALKKEGEGWLDALEDEYIGTLKVFR